MPCRFPGLPAKPAGRGFDELGQKGVLYVELEEGRAQAQLLPLGRRRYEILPVDLSVSSLSTGDLIGSLAGFAILYTALLIVEYWLMVRYAKLGPSSLGTGRYFFERKA